MDKHKEFQERFALLQELTQQNKGRLEKFLELSPDERKQFEAQKPGSEGKTAITLIDYEISYETLRSIIEKFPEDSVNSEETTFIKPGSPFEAHQDGVDVTSHASEYDAAHPHHKKWANGQLSWSNENIPFCFGISYPTINEMYTGMIAANGERELYKNGEAHQLPSPKSLLLGLNEAEYVDHLAELTGYAEVKHAGVAAWLILQGEAAGGLNVFDYSYEAATIMAVARVAGAKVTDLDGKPWTIKKEWSDEKAQPAVWSLPAVDHQTVLTQALKKLS